MMPPQVEQARVNNSLESQGQGIGPATDVEHGGYFSLGDMQTLILTTLSAGWVVHTKLTYIKSMPICSTLVLTGHPLI